MNILPLVMSWFLTLGYVPEMTNIVVAPTKNSEKYCSNAPAILEGTEATMAQIGLSLETQDTRLKLYTDIKSYQYASTLVSFRPFRVDYSIGTQFNINNTIHLNIDHTCVHPVSTDGLLEYNYSSSMTTLSLTVKGSTR